MRPVWLHTNGTVTPVFNDSGYVTGPGTGTIANLRRALDVAWQREVGVVLCLWSFDMLRSSNSATVLNRNRLLLTDTTYWCLHQSIVDPHGASSDGTPCDHRVGNLQ